MSSRKRWLLIALVWVVALTVGTLGWMWPPFVHVMVEELWPIGVLTGWFLHAGHVRQRARKAAGDDTAAATTTGRHPAGTASGSDRR